VGIGIATSIAANGSDGALGSGSAGTSQTMDVQEEAQQRVQFTLTKDRENQIGNTLAGRLNDQAPIRVTVLESDIQESNRRSSEGNTVLILFTYL
jgi:hypothetical protein